MTDVLRALILLGFVLIVLVTPPVIWVRRTVEAAWLGSAVWLIYVAGTYAVVSDWHHDHPLTFPIDALRGASIVCALVYIYRVRHTVHPPGS